LGANSSEQVLLSQINPYGLSLRTQFLEQSCDMRGLISGKITTDFDVNPDGYLAFSTLNPSHSNADEPSSSVPDCDSVDARSNFGGTWSNDTSVRFDAFNPICEWDIEILAP
jgi:hypothetical protein